MSLSSTTDSERRVGSLYGTVAIHWLNASLLFSALTLMLGCAFYIRDRMHDARMLATYNPDAIKSMTAGDARAMFSDFWVLSKREVSRPWIGFSEPPFHRGRIHIDPDDPLPL